TMEHLAYGDGTNVLGPGGTANSEFSATDLQFLEMVGWQVNYPQSLVPEPSTATLSLLALAALAARRRRME
ncbi:MAG: PEP-CTERM sorting domain-containing protein, partial [Akkermansia sp.]|nr:PEP-CTERM sorting domain-containing protein [Akkermansia sp.]